MDLSFLLLTTVMAGLFLAGAGVVAAMVVLERPSGQPATAHQDRSPRRVPPRRSRRRAAS